MGIWVPRKPARMRACGGPRKRNTKERANPRGARGALHAKASGRAGAITARASTSRLSCQSIGWRRLVALLCRGTLSRKHIQAASRRRHPRQAYHRLRPKKGSQPWRRRWLSFDSELPSWRSTSGARPPGSLRVHRHDGSLVGCAKSRFDSPRTASGQDSHGSPRPLARVRTASGQDSHGLWPGFARPRDRICSRSKAGVSDKNNS